MSPVVYEIGAYIANNDLELSFRSNVRDSRE